VNDYKTFTTSFCYPEGQQRLNPSGVPATITLVPDYQGVRLISSDSVFSDQDSGKWLYIGDEVRRITEVLGRAMVVIDTPFTVSPSSSAFQVITPLNFKQLDVLNSGRIPCSLAVGSNTQQVFPIITVRYDGAVVIAGVPGLSSITIAASWE
jgi:hypothetical protein